MATKYHKHPKATWSITWMGGNTLVDYRPDQKEEMQPEGVYIPRVGVFVKAKDIHQARIFIPARAIVDIRSLWYGGGETQDEFGKWVEYQCMTNSEQRKFNAQRAKTGFDAPDDES